MITYILKGYGILIIMKLQTLGNHSLRGIYNILINYLSKITIYFDEEFFRIFELSPSQRFLNVER